MKGLNAPFTFNCIQQLKHVVNFFAATYVGHGLICRHIQFFIAGRHKGLDLSVGTGHMPGTQNLYHNDLPVIRDSTQATAQLACSLLVQNAQIGLLDGIQLAGSVAAFQFLSERLCNL